MSSERQSAIRKKLKISFALYLISGLVVLGISLLIENIYCKNIFSSISGTLLTIAFLNSIIEFQNHKELVEKFDFFGDFFNHGFSRIYENKDDESFKNDILNHRQKAKDIKILSLIGTAFTENPSNIAKTIDFIKNHKRVIFLFINPNSNGHTYRYEHLEPNGVLDHGVQGRDSVKLMSRFKNFYDALKNSTELESSDVELKFFDVAPVFGIEIYDETMFVLFYGLNSRGVSSPILKFKKRSNSLVYNYFLKQWENYYINSKRLDF